MNQRSASVPDLLVSVRSAEEVEAALVGGADWIDLKEPRQGALGAVTRHTACEAIEALDGRCTLSAALGELRDWQDSRARELLELPDLSIVKLGLAGCAKIEGWQQRWLAAEKLVEEYGKKLVSVIYADWESAVAPSPMAVGKLAGESFSTHLLIDTFDKNLGSTFDHFAETELTELLQASKRASLANVLAGSITVDRICQIPLSLVDIVAVRGAVCAGERTGTIEAQRVRGFRSALVTRFADITCEPA